MSAGHELDRVRENLIQFMEARRCVHDAWEGGAIQMTHCDRRHGFRGTPTLGGAGGNVMLVVPAAGSLASANAAGGGELAPLAESA